MIEIYEPISSSSKSLSSEDVENEYDVEDDEEKEPEDEKDWGLPGDEM